ncbi:MAG: hypothetical protein IGS54_06725 [Elainella sp. C42_A2020_010]|nr:hypothetical protein [Elainella sp. C42_A2020_010]
MSEPNAPFNPQGQSESVDLSDSSVTQHGLPESMPESVRGADAADQADKQAAEQVAEQSEQSTALLDGNAIFDASELDNIAFEDLDLEMLAAEETDMMPQSQTLPASVAANLSSIGAWSQEGWSQEGWSQQGIDPAAVPNLSELISLIQELNQCNSVLMERVSQLEEALEDSQSALQAEVGRTQDVHSYNAQDWAIVQEQVTTLFNQLEFAHQTNQRQQILIETLTGQLETSQERVAQLEREAALIQQRYNEQTQLLTKSESTCRDLQSRLQRQQRYTLQFKAALEKSLEVPTPHYETPYEPAASVEPPAPVTEAPFLPKAQRIKPWSAQTSIQTPWMKLHQLDLSEEQSPPSETPASASANPTQTTHLNLPSFDLPLLHITAHQSPDHLPEQLPEQPVPAPEAPMNPAMGHREEQALEDYSLEEQVHQLVNDPALQQQLDQVVQPLADLLAEALLAESSPAPASQLPETSPTHVAPLPSAEPSSQPTSADELLAATMADAEDALWQDLARLIDVSTEDVVKASLSGDLAAFESLEFTRQSPSHQADQATAPLNAVDPLPAAETTAPELGGDAAAIAPLIRRIGQTAPPQIGTVAPPASPPVETEAPPEADQIPAFASSSWPSPVVYPLRPGKKRQSLAMVDLPSFPRS